MYICKTKWRKLNKNTGEKQAKCTIEYTIEYMYGICNRMYMGYTIEYV